jgi:positive regulator of sigma E activity
MKVIERARVLSREDGRARVSVVKPDDASGCERCAHSSCCSSGAGGPKVFVVSCGPEVSVGEEITVELELASPAWAAFILFIVPLMCAFAGGIAAFAVSGLGVAGVLGALGAAALAYLGVYLTAGRSHVNGRAVGRGHEGEGADDGAAGA